LVALIIGVLVAGVVAVVASVASQSDDTPAAAPAADSPCPLDPHQNAAVQPNQYTGVAQPYTGRGPHLLTFYMVAPREGTDPAQANQSLHNPSIPSEWEPTSEVDMENPARVQLVLCQYVTEGAVVHTCAYGPNPTMSTTSTTLVEGTYLLKLYAAATGKLVAQVTLHGTGDCPYSLPSADGVVQATTPRLLDSSTVDAALRNYVETPAP
jgi:hypothetical protein